MKIRTKSKNIHTIKVSERELDTLQLAVALMIESPTSHPNWQKTLRPMLKEMRASLTGGDMYEPVKVYTH